MGINRDSMAYEELERLVDGVGLKAVVEGLADIASEKADHVAANWQDKALAEEWNRNANRLRSLNSALE